MVLKHSMCTAPAAPSYPSLKNSFNGCSGPSPSLSAATDRPRVTGPDSNDVRTRSIYSTISVDEINAKAVEA